MCVPARKKVYIATHRSELDGKGDILSRTMISTTYSYRTGKGDEIAWQ
jgi:hypothetical protein